MFGAHPWSWLLIILIGIIWRTHLSTAELRVVCYYTNWSVYRPGTAKFSPQNINPYLCTHLIYAFGGFTKENTFKPFDKYQDIEKGGYSKFTGLKTYNKELKTLMAVGGWNEGSSRFSAMVANSDKRREFVKNSVKFLRQNHFDGLDLDWEYPSFRDGGKPHDRENYASLVQELREEYDREAEKTGRPRLLLTMAVPAGTEYINKGYDVPKLMKYLDWMNILSYDYHSAFEPSLNHHSPLYSLEEESEYNYDSDLNINHTIQHYFDVGADRNKLVLGIPTYGRSYTLFNPEATNIGDAADGPGEMGEATRENGYLSYYEICERIKSDSNWVVKQPNPNAMGPYAHKENQWVGYDDEGIVRKKAEYVAENRLGGIMFWSIDNDDFRGTCHGRPYPLIEAAKEALIQAMGSINENTIPAKEDKPSPFRNRNRKPSAAKTDEEDVTKPKKRIRNQSETKRPRPKTTTEQALELTEAPKRRIKVPSKRRLTTTTTETPSNKASTTPRWQTPEPPTTPDPGGDFKCEDEGFFSHPRDCKKYYWCLSGPSETGIIAHQFTCPSGLHFNKLADSCDYTQNVLCTKKPKTTAATSTSTTTSTPASTTTTTYRTTPRASTVRSTTTTAAPEEEYDEEYEDDDIGTAKNSEEDPKVIKELIDLIKKAGGIEELEKQLKLNENGGTSITAPGSTTPAAFNKSLYERILANRAKLSNTEKPASLRNSRGPQYEKSSETISESNTASKRPRPQYTAISRHRSTTEEDPNETLDENVADDFKPTKPDYKIITRSRPSTSGSESDIVSSTTATRLKNDVEEEVSKQTPLEYVTLRRSRPTTTEVSPTPSKVSSTTETLVTNDDQAIANELSNNAADKPTFEPFVAADPSAFTNKVEVTSPASSITSTQKVSETVSHKNQLRSRFISGVNRHGSLSTVPTQRATITESTPKRAGSRFISGDIVEQQSDSPNNYERKFRPDISSEISDLSSLTSADLASGRRNNNISRRPHVRRLTTTTEEVQQAGSDTVPEVRKQFLNKRISRTTTASTTVSTTTLQPSPRVSSRSYATLQRKRSENATDATTENVVSPSRRMRKVVRRFRVTTTENNQIVAKGEDENVSLEEGENIKLSESKIRLNSLSNDDKVKDEPLGKNKYTKEYNDIGFIERNPAQRTKIVDKLNERLSTHSYTNNVVFTESTPIKRTRKVNIPKGSYTKDDSKVTFTEPTPTHRARKVVRKLITSTTESTTANGARTRKIIRRLRPFTEEALPNNPERQTLEIYESPRRKVFEDDTTLRISVESQKRRKVQNDGNDITTSIITENQKRRKVQDDGNTDQDEITTPIIAEKPKRRKVQDGENTTQGITTRISTEIQNRRNGNTNQDDITTPISTESRRVEYDGSTNRDVITTHMTRTSSGNRYTEYSTPSKTSSTDDVQDTYSTVPYTINQSDTSFAMFTQPSQTFNDLASTLAVFASVALESNREESVTEVTPSTIALPEQAKDTGMASDLVPTTESFTKENVVQNSTSPSTVLFLIVASNTDTSTNATQPEQFIPRSTPSYYNNKSRSPFLRQQTRTSSSTEPTTVSTSHTLRFNKRRTTETTKDIEEDVTFTEIELGNRFADSTSPDTERPRFRPRSSTTETPTSRRSSRRYSGISRTTPTPVNIVEKEAKHSRNKLFSNRNRKVNTPFYEASSTTETVTLQHVFAETTPTTTTNPPQTSTSPKDKKVERLIEVNRIVEVSLKENKIQKHHPTIHNEFTLVPSLDRIGAINRITEIKVVDPEIEQDVAQHLDGEAESSVKAFTPKPSFNVETSTIALQALFSKNTDELLETQHAHFVNVRVLKQDSDKTKKYRKNEEAPFVPIWLLKSDEVGSRARVVEVTPRVGTNIKIAPISFSFSQKNIN